MRFIMERLRFTRRTVSGALVTRSRCLMIVTAAVTLSQQYSHQFHLTSFTRIMCDPSLILTQFCALLDRAVLQSL